MKLFTKPTQDEIFETTSGNLWLLSLTMSGSKTIENPRFREYCFLAQWLGCQERDDLIQQVDEIVSDFIYRNQHGDVIDLLWEYRRATEENNSLFYDVSRWWWPAEARDLREDEYYDKKEHLDEEIVKNIKKALDKRVQSDII